MQQQLFIAEESNNSLNQCRLDQKILQYQTPEKSKDSSIQNLIFTNSTTTSLSPFSVTSPESNIKLQINANKEIFEEEILQEEEVKTLIQELEPFDLKSSNKSKSNRQLCFDRYIPSRINSNLQIAFTELHQEGMQQICQMEDMTIPELEDIKFEDNQNVQELFKSHVLNIRMKPKTHEYLYINTNILQYSVNNLEIEKNDFVNLPTEEDMQNIGFQKKRKIPLIPYKILDAPQLRDDYYMNVLDWSYFNVLAVGLDKSVYLWSQSSSKATKLLETRPQDHVTSLQWSNYDEIIAVGTNLGIIEYWDVNKLKLVYTALTHDQRICALSWNQNVLSSGSRDKNILNFDIRNPTECIYKFKSHRQEVCGLKWSPDGTQLASGGNDNKLILWQAGYTTPTYILKGHTAAVKAIAWSTQQSNLLISGGGSADKTLRFWNSINGTEQACVDTGSQVCNLIFSAHSNEFVSTHGYSNNEINLWSLQPNLHKITCLTGHSFRVLYLAKSPDGTSIVTGAGDQTLRFWNLFEGKQCCQNDIISKIRPNMSDLR